MRCRPYPEIPRFWRSGNAGSAGRSSAATARQRVLGAAAVAERGRGRGEGAGGWRPCGGRSAREANAEAAISDVVTEAEGERRPAMRRQLVGETTSRASSASEARPRLWTRGVSTAVLRSRRPLPRPGRTRDNMGCSNETTNTRDLLIQNSRPQSRQGLTSEIHPSPRRSVDANLSYWAGPD